MADSGESGNSSDGDSGAPAVRFFKRQRPSNDRSAPLAPMLDEGPWKDTVELGAWAGTVVVRFIVADGLGNQLWRMAAALEVARDAQRSLPACKRAVVLAVEENAWQPGGRPGHNMSPHDRTAPIYTDRVWRMATTVLARVPKEPPTTEWGGLDPAETRDLIPILIATPANPLFRCDADATYRDPGHDKPTPQRVLSPDLLESLEQALAEPARKGPAIVDLFGCFQRVGLIPPLPWIRHALRLNNDVWPSFDRETMRHIPSTKRVYHDVWIVHLRLGDYEQFLDRWGAGDFDSMLAYLEERIESVARSSLKPCHFLLVVHPDQKARSERFMRKVSSGIATRGHQASFLTLREPVELLMLLSSPAYLGDSCVSYICPPSSLSWWAAALSNARRIMIPYPWMRLFAHEPSMIPEAHFGRIDPQPWRWEPIAWDWINHMPGISHFAGGGDGGDSEDGSDDSDAENRNPIRIERTRAIHHHYYMKTYAPDLQWAQVSLLCFWAHFRATYGVRERFVVEADASTVAALEHLWERVREERSVLTGEPADFVDMLEMVFVTQPRDYADSYNGQQCCKLRFAFGLAEEQRQHAGSKAALTLVTFLDADVIPFAPFSFATFVPDGERPRLLYTPYEEVGEVGEGAVWRAGVEHLLGRKVPNEYMRRMPLTYHASTVMHALELVSAEHGRSVDDLLAAFARSPKGELFGIGGLDLSEFNLIGAVAHLEEGACYECTPTKERTPLLDLPFKQYWSHDWRADSPRSRAIAATLLGASLPHDTVELTQHDPQGQPETEAQSSDEEEEEGGAGGKSKRRREVKTPGWLVQAPSGLWCPMHDSHFLPWAAIDGVFHQRSMNTLVEAALSAYLRAIAHIDAVEEVICLDIGAYIGTVSLAMAEALGDLIDFGRYRAIVCSFEPNPIAFAALRRNEQQFMREQRTRGSGYPMWISEKMALTNQGRVGKAHCMREPGSEKTQDGGRGASDTVAGWTLNYGATDLELMPEGTVGSVRTSTVDARTRANTHLTNIELGENAPVDGDAAHGAVAVVKIDAEGCELEILEGALATLDRSRPFLIIEIVPGHLSRHHASPQLVLEILDNAGYEPIDIVQNTFYRRAGGNRAMAADYRAGRMPAQADFLFGHKSMLPPTLLPSRP